MFDVKNDEVDGFSKRNSSKTRGLDFQSIKVQKQEVGDSF